MRKSAVPLGILFRSGQVPAEKCGRAKGGATGGRVGSLTLNSRLAVGAPRTSSGHLEAPWAYATSQAAGPLDLACPDAP
jgi:hypothetical protein